jgi:hypothetical protein
MHQKRYERGQKQQQANARQYHAKVVDTLSLWRDIALSHNREWWYSWANVKKQAHLRHVKRRPGLVQPRA